MNKIGFHTFFRKNRTGDTAVRTISVVRTCYIPLADWCDGIGGLYRTPDPPPRIHIFQRHQHVQEMILLLVYEVPGIPQVHHKVTSLLSDLLPRGRSGDGILSSPPGDFLCIPVFFKDVGIIGPQCLYHVSYSSTYCSSIGQQYVRTCSTCTI